MQYVESHRNLAVWQEAITLVELVYHETASFPRREWFGLTAQLRRCVISIPSNIAEGSARNSTNELIHFVGIANGSRAELDTQLEIALRLGYLRADSALFQQIKLVGKLLVGLRKSLRKRQQ